MLTTVISLVEAYSYNSDVFYYILFLALASLVNLFLLFYDFVKTCD